MSFYIGSVVFVGGSIASFIYLYPNWGFVFCGMLVSAICGKHLSS